MPIDFDPAWEYYVPDAEVADCIESVVLFDERGDEEDLCIRFGSGDPDIRDTTYLGAIKGSLPDLPPRRCAACNHLYRPVELGWAFCSVNCYQNFYRQGRRRNKKRCKNCSSKFMPKKRGQTCCSVLCSTQVAGSSHKIIKTNAGNGKCLICGGVVPPNLPPNHTKPPRKYCSERCKCVAANRRCRLLKLNSGARAVSAPSWLSLSHKLNNAAIKLAALDIQRNGDGPDPECTARKYYRDLLRAMLTAVQNELERTEIKEPPPPPTIESEPPPPTTASSDWQYLADEHQETVLVLINQSARADKHKLPEYAVLRSMATDYEKANYVLKLVPSGKAQE